jgi:DNA-binding NarL/FixJ family response regulator
MQYVLMMQTDPDDKDITETALTEIAASMPVHFIAGMHELNDFVTVSGEPGVILINDQGAGHQGRELLKQLKSDTRYNHIPVVILGEVTTPEYIRQCYRSGANTFIIKPSTLAATRKKIKTFISYWGEVAEV